MIIGEFEGPNYKEMETGLQVATALTERKKWVRDQKDNGIILASEDEDGMVKVLISPSQPSVTVAADEFYQKLREIFGQGTTQNLESSSFGYLQLMGETFPGRTTDPRLHVGFITISDMGKLRRSWFLERRDK